MELFYVYILEHPDGKLYTGHTQNLEQRVLDHNRIDSTRGKYTRKNGPWKLVWSESHTTRSSAMQRENEIKRWKSSAAIRHHLLKR